MSAKPLGLIAEWPTPATVSTLITTREGGVSQPPYASLNLGLHVGDDPQAVAANRAILREHLPAEPVWLEQVHGVTVIEADCLGTGPTATPPTADASISRTPGVVCTVMTADCLPVLLTDVAGTVVGAAHAGWRGLCGGVLEATVKAMDVPGDQIIAWLGPAIGPEAFEVGAEVRDAFLEHDQLAERAFTPITRGKYLADIYQLAKQRLSQVGVMRVFGGNFCTVIERERFYSYRRDHTTGRMASCIWIKS